jgi:phospho-N-acetylmuramoyl-pentapeptide-transferase
MIYLGLAIVIILAFMAAVLFTYSLIPILKKSAGQNIREEGPEAHQAKAGTPSMGGIAIVIAIVIASGVGGFFSRYTVIMVVGTLLFALIGFIDDYLKVIKKQNEGLKAWQKAGLQLIFAIAIPVYTGYFTNIGTEVFIPFAKIYVDFGIMYVPFIAFTILAMVNAVNLTDGLDGLASGVTSIVAGALLVIAIFVGAHSPLGFFGAIVGACLGFLVFNKNPAKIFMGDTGSLALGGAITIGAIMMKMELILPVIGLIYVCEVVSVCMQVLYFKATHGKRIFRMTPLHHHFELGGWHEKKVVRRFCLFTLVVCIIGVIAVI